MAVRKWDDVVVENRRSACFELLLYTIIVHSASDKMVLTKKDLDEAVERLIKIFDEKFSGISDRITSLEDSAEIHRLEIADHNNKITQLQNENAVLQSKVDELSQSFKDFVGDQQQTITTNSQLFNKLHEIEERVEDRTNRQLRQTIIISGLRERRDETWEVTK